MISIELQGIGKKFNTEWIFRNLSFTFTEQSATAIAGRNGTGKSTLLQIIARNLTPEEGRVTHVLDGKEIDGDHVFRHLALVAPYMELVEEFTLREMLEFHFSFKPFLPGFDVAAATELLGFPGTRLKQIRQFSSGMKQRVKLVTAVLSDVPLLLLDEPIQNLDQQGIEWYLDLIGRYGRDRTLIVCSNQQGAETGFAGKVFNVEECRLRNGESAK